MDIKAILTPKRKLNWFDKLVLVINIVAVTLLLLSYLAPIINPRSFWPIALIGLGYQLLFPINILFLIYWVFRSAPFMLVSGLCILIGLGMFLKNWQFSLTTQPDKKAFPDEIRIMSYNVHDFTSPVDTSSTRNAIARFITGKQPDIVALQEYTVNILDYKLTAAALSKAMQSTHHYFRGFDNTSWDSTGIAIYSRYPILHSGIIYTPDKHIGIQAIYVDVRFKNKIFRIYTMHLQPTNFEAPEHQYLHQLAHSGKISLHAWMVICRKLKIAFAKRSYQVALLKQHMASCPYPYIASGDFNDTPISFTANQIGKGLTNAFIAKGNGFGISYYGDFPHLQIDYILASKQFDVLNYQVAKRQISDHYPVISDMRLN
jgi:endonuclease/exonuclease/phosphatase family metal-dependent hydrolase